VHIEGIKNVNTFFAINIIKTLVRTIKPSQWHKTLKQNLIYHTLVNNGMKKKKEKKKNKTKKVCHPQLVIKWYLSLHTHAINITSVALTKLLVSCWEEFFPCFHLPNVLANPKSQSLTTPDLDTKIFSGLTSLWMI